MTNSRPPRVLLVHNRYRFTGGEERVVSNELNLLRSHGHAVELVEFQSETIQGLTQKIKTAWELPYSKRAGNVIEAAIQEFHPDLLHVHNFFPLGTTAVHTTARRMGVPVVQSLHNYRVSCLNGLLFRDGAPCTLCLGNSLLPGIQYRCYQGSLPGSLAMARMIHEQRKSGFWQTEINAFIALSNFSKANFMAAGLPEQKITVKPNFLDSNEFANSLRPARERADYFLYVGRLSQEKGIFRLLELWQRAQGQLGCLKVLGGGPEEGEVRKMAENISNVEILGQQPRERVAAHIQEAMALVFPSLCFENFPMSPLEAMAQGLPVAAHNAGAVPEMIQNNRTGVLFNWDDSEGTLQELLLLKDSPEKRDRLAAAAFEHAKAHYSAIANYQSLMSVYKSVQAEL